MPWHNYVFVSFRPPYLCPSEGHKHGVSVHILINLNNTLIIIFFEYLLHKTLQRPESLWDCLNIHLLLPLWFLTLFIEWFWWWCDSENQQLLLLYCLENTVFITKHSGLTYFQPVCANNMNFFAPYPRNLYTINWHWKGMYSQCKLQTLLNELQIEENIQVILL